MAGNRGVVISIAADDELAQKALARVRQSLRETQATTDSASSSTNRFSSAAHGTVPAMAAASAGLRALEGNFTNNIRAGERFLSMLPGVAEVLQTAFPAIGVIVLGTALVRLGSEAFHAFQNIVELKGAIESLNNLEITVAKKVQTAADETEAALERSIEATQGKAAALKQKLAYQSSKGLDLSDYFYNDDFKKLQTNIKADYETMYKNIAPEKIPERLRRIRKEVVSLKEALRIEQSGEMGMMAPRVGGFGPGTIQDPEQYYKARIKAASQIQQLLEAENGKRGANIRAIHDEGTKAGIKKLPETNPITDARASWEEEVAKTELEGVRSTGRAKLAEWEAQHRESLASEQDYLNEKFAIQNTEFDAEQKALTAQRSALDTKLAAQRQDGKLKKDKTGTSAEVYKTLQEIERLKQHQADLDAKRLAAESTHGAEVDTANKAAEIASLRIAAQLEREKGDGIERQIALIRREKELEAQKSTAAGGTTKDAANIKASGEIAVQKLQLADIQEDINHVESEHRRKLEEVNDAVTKGDMSKRAAAAESKAANAAELKNLQALVEKYRALAQAIGDPALLEKVKDLDAQVANLGRNDKRGTFGKELTDGMQSMTSKIMEQAALGRQSFGQMARGILDDIDRMALKMAEEKFLAPLFEGAMGGAAGGGTPTGTGGGFGAWIKGMFGAGGEAHASGGVGSDMPQVAGEHGPEIWTPPTRGGTYTTNAMLKSLANSGGGGSGRTPNVTTNVINQSSQPLQATTSQPSFDAQMREMVTHVILSDAHEGGQISQAFGH